MEIVRIPVLSDNYVWLVHEPVSGETMVVDPGVIADGLNVLDHERRRATVERKFPEALRLIGFDPDDREKLAAGHGEGHRIDLRMPRFRRGI